MGYEKRGDLNTQPGGIAAGTAVHFRTRSLESGAGDSRSRRFVTSRTKEKVRL